MSTDLTQLRRVHTAAGLESVFRAGASWRVLLCECVSHRQHVMQVEGLVAVGRAARRAERTARVEATVGKDAAPAALDLLELVEFAWHDCYGDITPGASVVEDILACSQGDLARMIRFARLAVEDWRDLRMTADEIRSAKSGPGTGELTC